MNTRKTVFNFAPGPAKLPDEVVERVERELASYNNSGISMLEMSHRSKDFLDLLSRAEQNLKTIISGFPPGYKILFMQGGGTGQFAAVPLNLFGCCNPAKPCADYLVTGAWSSKAAKEAEKYLTVNRCIDPTDKSYSKIAPQETWSHADGAGYLYYCSNETIHGVEFDFVPAYKGIPVVADMSSNFLSRPIDVARHGVIFAGAQKNIGTSGLTLAIVREDLLCKACKLCPSVLDYKITAENSSNYNTPPVFAIYVANLVFEWILDQGGIDEMSRRSSLKSKLIYDVIDSSGGFYKCPVDKTCRSRTTIPFRIGHKEGGDEALEKQFVTEATARKMVSLKGHRSVGGIRASLYNAISVAETEKLQEFMQEFHEKNSTK